jgi:hypothetical protein
MGQFQATQLNFLRNVKICLFEKKLSPEKIVKSYFFWVFYATLHLKTVRTKLENRGPTYTGPILVPLLFKSRVSGFRTQTLFINKSLY